MKLNKFAYLYSKPLENHTLKVMENLPGNLLKKPGNIMEFCQSEKVGTLSSFQLKTKHGKKWEKGKNTVKVIEFCQSGKVGTMKCLLLYTL